MTRMTMVFDDEKIREAIEFWLDRMVFKEPCVVKNVTAKTEQGYDVTGPFYWHVLVNEYEDTQNLPDDPLDLSSDNIADLPSDEPPGF